MFNIVEIWIPVKFFIFSQNIYISKINIFIKSHFSIY